MVELEKKDGPAQGFCSLFSDRRDEKWKSQFRFRDARPSEAERVARTYPQALRRADFCPRRELEMYDEKRRLSAEVEDLQCHRGAAGRRETGNGTVANRDRDATFVLALPFSLQISTSATRNLTLSTKTLTLTPADVSFEAD